MRIVFIILVFEIFSFNANCQYIQHICPDAMISFESSEGEKTLELLEDCLSDIDNVEDSLLLELNIAKTLYSMGRSEEADKILENASRPKYDKYKKAKCLYLERKARYYTMKDKNLNLKYWLQVDSLAQEINFKPGIIRAKMSIANVYYTLLRDMGSSHKYYMEALSFEDIEHEDFYLSIINGAFDTSFKTGANTTDSIEAIGINYVEQIVKNEITSKDSSFISTFYGVVANNYLANGHFRTALDHNLKAVDFKPKGKKYKYGLTRLYFNIAKIFQSLSNNVKAHEYADKIDTISTKYNYKSLGQEITALRGSTYLQEKQYEKAKNEYLKFFKLNKTSKIMQKSLQTTAYADMAFIAIIQDSLDKAEGYLSKGMETLTNSKEGMSHMNMHSILSNYHIKTKEFNQANADAKLLLKMSSKVNNVKFKNIAYQYLAEANFGLGNYKSAYQYNKQSKMLSDSIFKDEQSYLVHDLEAKYQKQEQDLKIETLQTKDLLSQERLNTQRKTILLGGVGLGLISILSFFLFRQGRKIRKQNLLINESLSEKELLLKEIHHRVKNNLQVVSSLLSLQSEYIKDDSALSAINEGRNRVKSMALIHQNLYQNDNLTSIDAKDYFNKLISGLFNSYNISEEKVKLDLDIQSIRIDVDTLVPLGLIVNELVSNALKYAFPKDQLGLILVKLTKDQNNQLSLLVEDNGVGFDPLIINDDISSFGYQMIQAFCEKLGAKLNIESDSNATMIKVIIDI